MASFVTMKFSDVLVVFVVFLGLFVEYLQYSAYIAIIGLIVFNDMNNNNFFYIGFLFSCQSIGYLLTINLSYKLCICFGYFIPMIFGSLISIWFTLLFSWNLHNYLMLIICRLIIAFGTTIISTSGWVYILYTFNDYRHNQQQQQQTQSSLPSNTASSPSQTTNDSKLNRNFVANISYFSISIAWIIGPIISLFLYSLHIDSSSNNIYPFYALVGIKILHLILFLLTSTISFIKYAKLKNWNWNKIKLFCIKNCCICYHYKITCKYIAASCHCSHLPFCHLNQSWKWSYICCCCCDNHQSDNINCCPFLFKKRSRKHHMRARSVLSTLTHSVFFPNVRKFFAIGKTLLYHTDKLPL